LASTTHTVAKTLGDLDLLEYEGTQRFSKLGILTHLSPTSSSVFLLKSRILWHVELACHFCMNWGFRRMTAIAEGEKYAGLFPGLVNLSPHEARSKAIRIGSDRWYSRRGASW
jgi:hypothetical protein